MSDDELVTDDLERVFNVSACERLARAEAPYFSTHGDYVPALARLLNATRVERDAAVARADRLEKALRQIVSRRAILSETCPAAPLVSAQTRMVERKTAMGGTGLEPAPPPSDSTRQRATGYDRNPLGAAGFRLLGLTNRDRPRQAATALEGANCPKPVQNVRLLDADDWGLGVWHD